MSFYLPMLVVAGAIVSVLLALAFLPRLVSRILARRDTARRRRHDHD